MIFVIVGPTGIGKSSLAEMYALKHDAYIVNGDAFQCYKEMNIGTAKPTLEERQKYSHFLFDIASVRETYTIYDYQKDLRKTLNDLLPQGKDIIIVGGSGLYLKSALYDFDLSEPINKVDLTPYEKLNDEQLFQKLIEIDEEASKTIHFHNRKRVMRAIQIYLESGVTKSAWLQKQEHKLLYDVIFVGLTIDKRENLYNLLNERVDRMVDEGLIDEVLSLKENYPSSLRAFQAIGYKEIFEAMDNNVPMNEAIEKIKKNTRNYAKRQYTYFKNQLPVNWFEDKMLALDFMEKKAKEVKNGTITG